MGSPKKSFSDGMMRFWSLPFVKAGIFISPLLQPIVWYPSPGSYGRPMVRLSPTWKVIIVTDSWAAMEFVPSRRNRKR